MALLFPATYFAVTAPNCQKGEKKKYCLLGIAGTMALSLRLIEAGGLIFRSVCQRRLEIIPQKQEPALAVNEYCM